MKIRDIEGLKELLPLYYKGEKTGIIYDEEFYCLCGEDATYETVCDCGNRSSKAIKINLQSPVSRRTVIRETENGLSFIDMKLHFRHSHSDGEIYHYEEETNSLQLSPRNCYYNERDRLSTVFLREVKEKIIETYPEIVKLIAMNHVQDLGYSNCRRFERALGIIAKYPKMLESIEDAGGLDNIFTIYDMIENDRENKYDNSQSLEDYFEIQKGYLPLINRYRNLNHLQVVSKATKGKETEAMVEILENDQYLIETVAKLVEHYSIDTILTHHFKLDRYYDSPIRELNGFVNDYSRIYGSVPPSNLLPNTNKDRCKIGTVLRLSNHMEDVDIETFFEELNKDPMKAVESMKMKERLF